MVGRIAENHLSKRAALQIKTLMGRETLAEASTWPDEVRSDPAWKQAAPWHYVSIDDSETYETTQKNPQGDIIVKMMEFEKTLRDSKAVSQDRVIALRFLVHFVGDVHQPLHVGRRADQGGNGTKVTWLRNATNLHAVWDYQIIDAQQLSFSEFAQFLDHPSAQEIKTWQSAKYLDWVQESFDRRGEVYEVGDGNLGYVYAYQHLPLIKTRLVQAGVRLAGLLNSIFQ